MPYLHRESISGMQPDNAEAILARCEFELRSRLAGMGPGEKLSGIPGDGIETRDIREYQQGDDVRRMAWAVLARTTVPHVKTFEAERDMTTWALVDTSPSMMWGTASQTKFATALDLVAGFSVLLGRQGNRLGGGSLREGSLGLYQPRRGRGGAIRLLARLAAETTRPPATHDSARDDLGRSLASAARALRKRSLILVISDFLDAAFERPLGQLALRNEVIAVRIGDPRERELVDIGTAVFVDTESGRQLQVDTANPRLREQYRANSITRARRVRESILRTGTPLLDVSTSRDWLGDLIAFVNTYKSPR